jgi:flagellar biosynthesis protein FliQ
MTEEIALNLGQNLIMTMVMLSAPILITAMAIGIVISILQAVTQINEATLTFIPKMVAVVVVLMVMSPWMLQVLKDYAIGIFGQFGEGIH